MGTNELLVEARHAAELSQQELAARARTSRPTLSAYEHGRKSPTLDTTARLLAEAGFTLALQPRITFTEQVASRGRTVIVPTELPRLSLAKAVAVVVLPIELNWSAPGRGFDLSDRSDRTRAYEIVLREGAPADILEYIDGALLIDLWDDLVLPHDVRAAWEPLVAGARRTTAQ